MYKRRHPSAGSCSRGCGQCIAVAGNDGRICLHAQTGTRRACMHILAWCWLALGALIAQCPARSRAQPAAFVHQIINHFCGGSTLWHLAPPFGLSSVGVLVLPLLPPTSCAAQRPSPPTPSYPPTQKHPSPVCPTPSRHDRMSRGSMASCLHERNPAAYA